MRIYLKKNVMDAARERVAWIFDEFPNVAIGMSGGKDSCVVYHLAMEEAKRRNRLPLAVIWIDQEAEWQATETYVKSIMTNPDVEPYWMQIPFKVFNATSHTNDWLQCWEEGAEWIRPKDPMSYKENIYGTDRFGELFNKITDYHWAGEPFALIGGVRTEESPTRFVALTQQATYKHVTWGKMLNQKMDHYTFYPIYDWTWQDVWKAIHDNGWPYNEIYNYMYQHGYQIRDMRVSNLHHETAIKHLLFVSQIENHTWSALTKRLDGVNTIKHLDKESMTCPAELPEAFENWIEYRDYLLDHLIVDEAAREKMRNHFANMDERYEGMFNKNNLTRTQITTIIVNDHHFTKCTNWENNFEVVAWRKWKKYGKLPPVKNQYIHG